MLEPIGLQLIDLMGDENHTLRMLAYQLALKIGQIEVQRLVVELELASEDLPQAGLPSELIASLSHVSDQGMGPFLLRWQLAMSLVDSAVSLLPLDMLHDAALIRALVGCRKGKLCGPIAERGPRHWRPLTHPVEPP